MEFPTNGFNDVRSSKSVVFLKTTLSGADLTAGANKRLRVENRTATIRTLLTSFKASLERRRAVEPDIKRVLLHYV